MVVRWNPLHQKKSNGFSCPFSLQSFAGVAAYCASKASADMLTKCAAVDLAPFGIRVNAVNPGGVGRVWYNILRLMCLVVVVTNLQKRGGMNDENYAAFLKRSIEVTHPLYSALQVWISRSHINHIHPKPFSFIHISFTVVCFSIGRCQVDRVSLKRQCAVYYGRLHHDWWRKGVFGCTIERHINRKRHSEVSIVTSQ